MRDLTGLDQYRNRSKAVKAIWGWTGDAGQGAFDVPSKTRQSVTLQVIACAAAGWDHISVTASVGQMFSTPLWPEMEQVKRLFFKQGEVCMQLHVAESEHINCHPHVLHIWRPWLEEIPLPPRDFV